MATADAPGRDCQLVHIVYNAIGCVLYQDEQIACFQNAARHLRPGGCFRHRALDPGAPPAPTRTDDWPSELDVMAKLAGLALTERVTDWDRSVFTGDSPSHVSAWQKPS